MSIKQHPRKRLELTRNHNLLKLSQSPGRWIPTSRKNNGVIGIRELWVPFLNLFYDDLSHTKTSYSFPYNFAKFYHNNSPHFRTATITCLLRISGQAKVLLMDIYNSFCAANSCLELNAHIWDLIYLCKLAFLLKLAQFRYLLVKSIHKSVEAFQCRRQSGKEFGKKVSSNE